jgi:predicted MFS family arabinose efflux permease
MKEQGLSKMQIGVMAFSAGVCVANIYYNQPILHEIANTFQSNESEVGLISVLSQAGYGLGLFFITPLGDKTNRKTLVLLLQALLVLALLGLTLMNELAGVYAMSLLIGLFSVAAQVILPMAASLDKQNRGRTVGIIFTGILIGILAARVFSGYITEWFGWRYVYGISAAMAFCTALMVQFSLPNMLPAFEGSYAGLLRSTLAQAKRFALLRRTALLGALVFGAFCSFWTTLTFYLSRPPFHFRADIIGQFGVLLITFFPANIISFVLAVLLLDVGVQATQVTNIATIYTLDDKAHSRINTVYMTCYFIGGATGTFAGVQCWRIGGWMMVCIQLLIWSSLALVVAYSGYRKKVIVNEIAG